MRPSISLENGLTHLRMDTLEELSAGIGGLTALQEIDLSGCKSLKELPAELGALKELQKINLSGCRSLEKLPSGIGGLTALQEMDLSFCHSLKELPVELGALKELQKINLSECMSLEKLPVGIGGLTALQEIDLSCCWSLKELPSELGALKELQKINLQSWCKSLEMLPACICGLTALREIDLSWCVSLKELPAELGALKELQKINLLGCRTLEKLPSGIGGLTALREIVLSGCMSLKELPAELGALKWLPSELGALKELQKINLSGCRSLEKLPVGIGGLAALREIDLSECESLKELPVELGALTQLKDIKLKGCCALHTPPPHFGTESVLQFLRDLVKGELQLQSINLSGRKWLEKLPDWVGTLSELREMDLSGCSSLKELPVELGALKELQKINLSECRSLERLPTGIGGLTALREIDLSGCESLKELPAELGALKELQKIDLSGWSSEKLPVGIGGLTALREIDLSGCKSLKELPAELGALKELQKMDLSGCRSLEKLPSGKVPAGIGGLTALREIYLLDCSSLKELPAELGALKELKKINLSGCRSLEMLPVGIGGLTALRGIHLSKCESLKELPAELGALKELQKIDLSGCESLEKLPVGIGGLTALREIDLSKWKSFKELPVELGALKRLQKINLSGCESLERLSTGIGGLTALQEIDLSGCKSLKELPAELGALKELQKINLSGCRSLEKLPSGIGGLTALQEMVLSFCHSLKELPVELGALKELQKVNLFGCDSLHTPPVHVVKKGTAAVLEFLRDLAKGDAPCHLIKVVLLGSQRAGKSSLADSLVLGRPVTRNDSDRTVGIEVRRWPVGRESQLVMNIYDAAGQRVYRATHGLFMSADALFLHVVRSDVREDEAVETLLEWVEVVQQEAPGAVMGVVWTHIDCVSATVSKSRVLDRVHEDINEQMQAVDDAMREMEDDIADHLQDRRSEQGWDLHEKWMREREQRDVALKALDQRTMAYCTVEDEMVRAAGGGGQDQLSKSQSVGNGEPSGEQLKRPRYKIRHPNGLAIDFQNGVRQCPGAPRRSKHRHDPKDTISEMVKASANVVAHVVEAIASVVTHQHEMEVLEDHLSMSQSVGDGESLGEQLKRLRHKRLHRPRMLFSFSVSSRTGEGLADLRHALTALMENQSLFPHVGVKVPLNYSMLERLAQEARTQVSGDTEADSHPDADRASWEVAVTKHVKERASDGLRCVCKKPYVRLGELEEEASKVGMDKDEVLRALKFLHAAGSVLHYGSDTHCSSPELKNTVFMQPQFIIDAISYVIREPNADNVNDKVRKNDARIRQRSTDSRETIDRFLGCSGRYGCTEGHGSGVLPRWLLTSHLWRDFDPQDHRVLMKLMMAFKLMRPLVMGRERLQTLSERGNEQYLVPAMLRKSEMPSEYVEPKWWCPTKACAAAVKHADHRALAKMRIVYQVRGGRLPYGFMTELQVSLASMTHTESVDKELTSAPETAVVDRICGTVLSEAYTCGEGDIREWVIVSKAGPRHEQVNGAMTGLTTDCIRIMGWVELHPSSAEGATDWRLLRRIMREIESMEQRAPALCLRKMVLYVDAHGKAAKTLDIPHQGREFLRFTFEDGCQKQEVDVKREHVIPSDSWGQIKLVKPPEVCMSKGTLNVVDAFFAKKTDDHAINVHAEGQLMRRTVMDPGCGWDCSINPQPTIEDLYTSILFARQRNVRVLHLSGHAREECGFIWNANDTATVHKTFDIEGISEAIGKVAGPEGPVECVVLNACSTEKMGRLLRKQGVPCVLCWNTPVHDETVRDLVDKFYPLLVEDKSGSRDYKEAFLAAVKKMGALDAGRVDTTVSGESRRPSTTTRNASPDASSVMLERESANDQEYGKSSQDGPVRPCELDVVLFLSEDGDIGPFSLCCERLIASEPSSAPAGVGQAAAAEDVVDAGLKSLFVQNGLGAVCADVCRGLGVDCLDDLKLVTAQVLSDDLPRYVKEKLTPIQKQKLAIMIEGHRTVAGGVEENTNAATIRESRPAMAPPALASLPRIEGFFCKIKPNKEMLRNTIKSVRNADASDKDEKLKELDALVSDTVESIDPHKEAQDLTELLEKSNNRRVFEVKLYPQPTFKCFSDRMRTAAERNVRHLLFSGHGQSRWGFFWLKEGACEYEKIPTEHFLELFETEVAGAHGRGTIEGVVLNACDTEDLGKKLIDAGVQHVVCWRSEVYDSTASTFSCEFFTSFEENTNYKISFRQAVSRIFPGKGTNSSHKKQKHLHRDAVNYVCLLSRDGENEFPDTGHIRGRVEDDGGDTQTLSVEIDDDAQGDLQDSDDDGDIFRNWRPPKYQEDYGALAGQAERACLELLGFQMTLPGDTSPICVGKGIEPNGFIKDSRVFAMWGVRNYTSDVWGSTKKAVGEAKKLMSSRAGKSKVSEAMKKLKEVEDYRKKDMKKHGRVCEAHAHQLKQIEATRIALEVLTSPFNGLSAPAHARCTVKAPTRSETGPVARTLAPPPLTPSTRAPTALDEADDGELRTHVSLFSSAASGGGGGSGYRRLKLLLLCCFVCVCIVFHRHRHLLGRERLAFLLSRLYAFVSRLLMLLT
jgi:Leucine-rich repeat (LRR) protein/GTPase SAR1 family protein